MSKITKKELKLLIKYNTLLGNFTGTLEGILHWDIPKELKTKLELKIKQLKSKEV